VPEFLVEVYASRTKPTRAEPGPDQVSEAAEIITGQGRRVRMTHFTFIPEDETCLYFFDAESVDAVREAAARAGLQFQRVVGARSDR
jgi:hypothetical protein